MTNDERKNAGGLAPAPADPRRKASIYMSCQLYARAQREAARRKMTFSAYCEWAIAQYLGGTGR